MSEEESEGTEKDAKRKEAEVELSLSSSSKGKEKRTNLALRPMGETLIIPFRNSTKVPLRWEGVRARWKKISFGIERDWNRTRGREGDTSSDPLEEGGGMRLTASWGYRDQQCSGG